MSQNLPVTSDRTSPRTQGRRIGGLFSDLFSFDPLRAFYPALSGASNALAMEVSRSDGGYTIEFPVPGFRPEEIDVTVQGDTLTVSGKNDRRRLMRSITLPDEIDPDSIAANVDNGMLSLRLKERPENAPRRIQVQTGSAAGAVSTVSGESKEQGRADSQTAIGKATS